MAAVVDRRLEFLENGRTASGVASLLLDWASDDASLVVGLDFCFSLPTWYMALQGYADAQSLWRDAERCESWLHDCPMPFWGRAARWRRPALGEGESWYRATEALLPAVAGTRAKSVFQVGGAGSVGTGSLRGMALLAALHDGGFSIWPFDPPALPRVVEIYPRALTGAVRKSDAAARSAYLDRLSWPQDATMRALAASTEDAFDAAVSALRMAEHADELLALDGPFDPGAALEGQVWVPGVLRAPQ